MILLDLVPMTTELHSSSDALCDLLLFYLVGFFYLFTSETKKMLISELIILLLMRCYRLYLVPMTTELLCSSFYTRDALVVGLYWGNYLPKCCLSGFYTSRQKFYNYLIDNLTHDIELLQAQFSSYDNSAAFILWYSLWLSCCRSILHKAGWSIFKGDPSELLYNYGRILLKLHSCTHACVICFSGLILKPSSLLHFDPKVTLP